MKTRSCFILAGLLLSSLASFAATCDDLINQGRASLAVSNLVAANHSFSNAVVCSPTHSTGNVLYAVTRLLVLPQRPAGSNFLNRLGFPIAGRSIYDWTANPPADTNGLLLAPVGVNAKEATALLRTNILAEIIAAEANLRNVTSASFILDLAASETGIGDVTIDYGDVRMLLAGLKFAEYFIYMTYSWNLDVQLGVIRSIFTNGYTLERLFRDYPNLLTFTATNEHILAKTAFTNGIACYLEASQFIRNRPTNSVRLFNLDDSQTDKEANFRSVLIDLRNSLNGPVALAVEPDTAVYLHSHFTGTHSVRSFLPDFSSNNFVLGTMDSTFGGLITGLDQDEIQSFVANNLPPVPKIVSPLAASAQQFSFRVNTLRSRGYVVQVSSNLTQWTDATAFFAFGATSDVTVNRVPGARLFRLVERTANMPRPPNDNFADRISLSGLGIVAYGYTANATREGGEPGGASATVWWSWTAPISGPVTVSTSGSISSPFVQIYTGTAVGALTLVGYGNSPFFAVAGTTYQIQVNSVSNPSGIRLAISAPPTLAVSSPMNGFASTTPTNITVTASASDSDGSIAELRISTDYAGVIGRTTNSSISMVASNVGVGAHYFYIYATDNVGITTSSNVSVFIRPPNDLFANRIPISGAPAMVMGTNDGASKELNEPNHAGYSGGNSVWWTWTSPFTGPVTISAEVTSRYGYSVSSVVAVYTGNSVSTLTNIASGASPFGFPALASFNANSGTAYQIAVDGQFGGQGGNVILRITTP